MHFFFLVCKNLNLKSSLKFALELITPSVRSIFEPGTHHSPANKRDIIQTDARQEQAGSDIRDGTFMTAPIITAFYHLRQMPSWGEGLNTVFFPAVRRVLCRHQDGEASHGQHGTLFIQS